MSMSVPHHVSIVIPVYKGVMTLDSVMMEIAPLTFVATSPAGNEWIVSEVVLVYDNGPDDSAATIRELRTKYSFVRPVWLSRNYGQHGATLAGIASSGFEWIVTMDEDGQHDPVDIGKLLDAAIEDQAPLVYAKPSTSAPHGALRNGASRGAKSIVAAIAGNPATNDYQSFRLVLGEVGRSVAAYAGAGVYLDVALGWVASRIATTPIELRGDTRRQSGYSIRKLLGHFWRLILSSGTRGLRAVSLVGAVFAVTGVVLGIVFGIERMTTGGFPAGWASQIIVTLVASGAILFSLGVIAEYLGVVVNAAMGKPPYLIVSDPNDGPLGRSRGHS